MNIEDISTLVQPKLTRSRKVKAVVPEDVSIIEAKPKRQPRAKKERSESQINRDKERMAVLRSLRGKKNEVQSTEAQASV